MKRATDTLVVLALFVFLTFVIFLVAVSAIGQEPLDTTPPVTELRSIIGNSDVILMLASESIFPTTYGSYIKLSWTGKRKDGKPFSGDLKFYPCSQTYSAMWTSRILEYRPTVIEITSATGAFRDRAGNLNVAKTVKSMRDNHEVLEKS